jgi:hypothetical protein
MDLVSFGLADTARFAMAISVEFVQGMDRFGRRGTSWLFPFRSVSDMAWQTWQVQLRYVLECIGQDMADRSGFVGQVIGYDLARQTRWVGKICGILCKCSV